MPSLIIFVWGVDSFMMMHKEIKVELTGPCKISCAKISDKRFLVYLATQTDAIAVYCDPSTARQLYDALDAHIGRLNERLAWALDHQDELVRAVRSA